MTKHFSDSELTCHCGCGRQEMDSETLRKLEAVREELGLPMKLSRGYSCPEHNAKISKTGLTGPHTTGHAVDILCRGATALRIVELALKYGFTGIGVSQKGDSRFVHLDDIPSGEGPRPTIWSY